MAANWRRVMGFIACLLRCWDLASLLLSIWASGMAQRAHLLECAAAQAKTAASGMSEAELSDLIDEGVQWSRER